LPVATFTHLSDSITGNLRSMILPASAIAIGLAAVYVRLLRADMIQTLQEDFILMSRAQGIPPRRILLRHALRPSSFSLITIIGINTGALIGGSVIVEYYFALPGLGNRLFQALGQRELLIVQGLVLAIAAGYVMVNFLVDLLYTVIDPRIRHA
jgi:peptide/nickel transport system permease protein